LLSDGERKGGMTRTGWSWRLLSVAGFLMALCLTAPGWGEEEEQGPGKKKHGKTEKKGGNIVQIDLVKLPAGVAKLGKKYAGVEKEKGKGFRGGFGKKGPWAKFGKKGEFRGKGRKGPPPGKGPRKGGPGKGPRKGGADKGKEQRTPAPAKST